MGLFHYGQRTSHEPGASLECYNALTTDAAMMTARKRRSGVTRHPHRDALALSKPKYSRSPTWPPPHAPKHKRSARARVSMPSNSI